MSLIFERYLEDAQPEKDVDAVDDKRQRAIDDGEKKRKALMDRAKGGPINPDDTKGVWI